MSKPWILISPSSRGIGHALTAYLLRSTTLPILATARSDLSGVKESLVAASSNGSETHTSREDNASRLHVTYLDVTDESSVKAASAKAAEIFPPSSHHLHLAFALPGILHPEKQPRQVDYADALETFKVNTLGPLMLMKWFGEFLPRKGTDLSHMRERARTQATRVDPDTDLVHGAKGGGHGHGHGHGHGQHHEPFRTPDHATWLTNSARVGSTADNGLGGWYSYRASKAGVNSITKSFDLHLRTRSADKAMAVAYHPGTVKTGLSREFWGNVPEGKLFSPGFAVQRMLEVVASRTMEDRGKCWDWRGEEVPP
ncbi:short-chain dehydrogenase/reductase-like protein [Nemania serpens]|nr:short-chain dehydrogenase/reductase-like protein [Nemania serpens]